jgi:arylsulfatase A
MILFSRCMYGQTVNRLVGKVKITNMMTNRNRWIHALCFQNLLAFNISLLLITCVCSKQAPAVEPPHIVLIFADDLGINDLGCYGRTEHRTPHLDRLAASGLRYTNAYCGLGICSASRAALMTGKSPARLHLTSYLPGRPDTTSQLLLNAHIHSALPPEEKTLAEELKQVGYRTGLFGKWHLGSGASSPANQGFDVVFEPPAQGELIDTHGGKNEFLIAEKAAEFILEPSASPYFCYIPQHSPHIPLAATEAAMQSFAGTFSPLYAANIESLDRSVSIVLEAIQRRGDKRDTIIIFTSDNGGLHVPEIHDDPLTHNTPFRAGKGYLYEGGIRIPLIVTSQQGRFASPRVIDQPISLADLFPTLTKLAGIDISKTVGPVDGVDLSEHWLNQSELDGNRALFWHFPHYSNQGSRPSAAMRKGRWKLVRSFEEDRYELFDLQSDPGEQVDLTDGETEITGELTRELNEWLLRVGAQMSPPNPNASPVQHAAIYQEFDSTRLVADKSAEELGEIWKPWRSRLNDATRGNKSILKSPEGDIALWASQAMVHGRRIRYEPEPHKNVIGFWTEVDDWAHWDIEVPQAGLYEVEVQYGCGKNAGGSRVSLRVGDSEVNWTVRETGHFQQMIYQNVGQLELGDGSQQFELRAISKANIAVMDVRKIVMRRVASH